MPSGGDRLVEDRRVVHESLVDEDLAVVGRRAHVQLAEGGRLQLDLAARRHVQRHVRLEEDARRHEREHLPAARQLDARARLAARERSAAPHDVEGIWRVEHDPAGCHLLLERDLERRGCLARPCPDLLGHVALERQADAMLAFRVER